MANELNLAICIALFATEICFAIHPTISSTYTVSPFCLTDSFDKSDTRMARSTVDCASQCSLAESCAGFLYPPTGSCSLLRIDCFSSPRCSSDDSTVYQRILSFQDCQHESILNPSALSCECEVGRVGLTCERRAYDCDELYACGYSHGHQRGYIDVYKNQSLIVDAQCYGDQWVTITYLFKNNGGANMSLPWQDYVDGFRAGDGVYWMGLEGILALNKMGMRNVMFGVHVKRPDTDDVTIDMISHTCSNFNMEDENKGYAFTTDPCTLDNTTTDYLSHSYGLGDVLGMSSGRPFLSPDHDNSQHCATNAGTGCWFPDCSQGVEISPLSYIHGTSSPPQMILPGFNMSDPELRPRIVNTHMAFIQAH